MASAYFAQLNGDLHAAFASGVQFWIFLAALVYLWFAEKAWRKSVGLPVAILVLVLLNPPLYLHLWPRLSQYAFSRFLWMLPIVAVIAAACVSLVRKCKTVWLQGIVIVLLGVLLMRSGPYMYKGQDNGAGSYFRAENAYHLPDHVLAMSEFLVAYDPAPRVVCDIGPAPWMRLYSADIELYAGRYGYNVRTQREKDMQAATSRGDWEWVRERMQTEEYPYLLLFNLQEDEKTELQQSGFRMLHTLEDGTQNACLFELVKE